MTVSATPDDANLLLHAYVDGELDPAHALEVERQMARACASGDAAAPHP
jgi:anti-sigma factor RsiW